MTDTQLDDACPGATELHHELGVDHCAHALEIDPVEEVATKQLERAVDVAHRNVEEDSDDGIPSLGHDTPNQRVLAIHAEPGDDVDSVDPRQEALELVEVELVVGVREEDEVLGRLAEARPEGFAVSPVSFVTYETDAWIARRGPGYQLGRAIDGAVVDDDDLVLVKEPVGGLTRCRDRFGDVLFFVIRRHDERQSPSNCHGQATIRVEYA